MRLIDADALLKKAIQERRFVFTYKDIFNDELVVRTVYKDLAEFIQNAPTIYPPKTKWISVEERLPETGKEVLAHGSWGGSKKTAVARYSQRDDAWCAYSPLGTVAFVAITHWMPLPEPPGEEENNE